MLPKPIINMRKNKSLSIDISNSTERESLQKTKNVSNTSQKSINVRKKQQHIDNQTTTQIISKSKITLNLSTPVHSTHHSRQSQSKENQQLTRNHSANSIISQLQYEIEDDDEHNKTNNNNNDNQMENIRNEDRLVIKICDGIYIGSEQAIWDIQTMTANYITHLITVYTSSQDSQQRQNNYVPQIVSYIHSLNYDFHKSEDQVELMETYKKIVSFVQHAQQEGESCLIICRNRGQHQQTQSTHHCSHDEFSKVYEPAAIVCGYLMFKYGWSMLKGLQFVSSRLTAGQKTAQVLHRVNNAKIGSSSSNLHSQRHKNAYSGLIAHLVPELPHGNYTQCPNISAVPLSTLSLLQAHMVEAGRCLSYGWDSTEDRGEETVLSNTFLNCIMGSDFSQSYTNLLSNQTKSHGNLPKIQIKANVNHRKSSKSIGFNKQNELNFDCNNVKNVKRLSVNNANEKKLIKSNSIQKKDSSLSNQHVQKSQKIQIYMKQQSDSKQQSNDIKSCLRQNNHKNQKRINWSQNLIKQQIFLTNAQFEKQQLTSSPLSKQALEYKQNLKRSLDDASTLTKNGTKSNKIAPYNKQDNKNKIIVDVIQIINSKYKQSERNRNNINVKVQGRLLNKKTKIYKSKATLPTINQILKNSKQKTNQYQFQQQASKCKTSPHIQQFELLNQCQLKSISEQQLNSQINNKMTYQQKQSKQNNVDMDVLYSQGNESNHKRINLLHHKFESEQTWSSNNINNKQNTQIQNNAVEIKSDNTEKISLGAILNKGTQTDKQKIIKATIENLKMLTMNSSGTIQHLKIKCLNKPKKSSKLLS